MNYKNIVDEKVFGHLRLNTPKGILYDACKHAITGGKRTRSCIVLGMAGYTQEEREDFTPVELAAISVEYLHTASLIIDDLPCMDNDLERRGVPTVHAKYGERVAQLASTSLMAATIDCLAQSVEHLDKKVGLFIIRFVAERMGPAGASGGEMKEFQYGKDTPVKEIIHMKTSTFFEISMILGWLLGGPDRSINKCRDVSEAAKYLGLAYQIADDMEDVEQDMKSETKDANYVIKYGLELSKKEFEDSLVSMENILPIEAQCEPLNQLVAMLRNKVRAIV